MNAAVNRSLDLVMSAKFRQWLYGVALAMVPILIIYGVISTETAALWSALVAAILGQGTAFVALAQQRRKGIITDGPADTGTTNG